MSRKRLEKNSPDFSAAERLLFLLKTRGPQTAADLGQVLKTTGEAARQQLLKMAESGYVQAHNEVRGVGRPAQVWKLTGTGHERFPDTHGELTVRLLDTVKTVLGESALDQVIAAREKDTRNAYKRELESAGTLEERVAGLAVLRTREGYMAEWKTEGEGYLLVENHCPICAAAKACIGFCRSELSIFQDVFGPSVDVQRVEHILSGARRCAYRIIPRT